MIKRCSKDEFVEGAIFHIYNKTMKSLKLFYNDSDYRSFLEYFSKFYKNYPCTIFAYCLMPNHYHLLAQTPDSNISRAMRHLNGVYTQRYNRIHHSPDDVSYVYKRSRARVVYPLKHSFCHGDDCSES